MNCRSLINDFLLDYHGGTLPMARRVEFEFHLTLCQACRAYVDSYKKTVDLARTAAASEAPAPPQELIDIILNVTRGDQRQ